jgi:predicted ATPase
MALSRTASRGPTEPPLRRIALTRETLDEQRGYPFDLSVIASFERLDVRRRVLFLVGENGSGKSTFLEALALSCGFASEGGTRNLQPPARVSADPRNDDTEAPVRRLARALRLSWTPDRQRDGFFMRAETFYDFASVLDRSERERDPLGPSFLGAYGGASLHDRSHGESFLTLFLNRFSGRGLYLLDEPEAALSAARQMTLLVRIHDLLSANRQAQFVIATHSPIILAYPDAQIVSFDGERLHEIAYRQTDAYLVTRRFLSDPDTMLRRLFESDETSNHDDRAKPDDSAKPDDFAEPGRAHTRTRARAEEPLRE